MPLHQQVRAWVERQAWLDDVGGWLGTVTGPLIGRPKSDPLLSTLRGDWLGHPLHPAVTDVPIGCWTASLLMDLVCESGAAGVLTVTGTAAAVPTAVTGLVDWSTTEGGAGRLATLHALLNTAAVGMQLCSFGARVRRRRLRAVTWSALGLTTALASGWLGGEVAFDTAAATAHPTAAER